MPNKKNMKNMNERYKSFMKELKTGQKPGRKPGQPYKVPGAILTTRKYKGPSPATLEKARKEREEYMKELDRKLLQPYKIPGAIKDDSNGFSKRIPFL